MTSPTPPPSDSRFRRVVEVGLFFLKLGLTAFGGPAAHIAMLHAETVRQRKWLDEQHFLDLLGATNLIPGPNSTEMAIHLGYLRAGWPGLIVGGVGFILPAMLIVMGLAWAYVRFGTTVEAGWLLYGIKPVIIAIVAKALWELGQKAIRGPLTTLVGLAALGLYFFNVNEIALLVIGGLIVMLGARLALWRKTNLAGLWLPLTGLGALNLGAPLLAAVPFSLPVLFFTFLKIGSVLYGSGYVLLAFVRADFVVRLGWLTDQQLIDAVAVGQITPGPVFTTATFIGYVLGGVPGALLATAGIFLPAFVFVALSHPLIPHLRNSPWVGSFLDGINAASLGLMAAVTWQLGRASLVDPLTLALAATAAFLLFRFKLNATWLVLGGAAAGLLRAFFS